VSNDTYILGLNYRPLGGLDIGHHPAAALLKNGEVVVMCEEERFVRIKEAPGLFPIHATLHCLARAGITVRDLAAIGWNWSPLKAAQCSKRQKALPLRGLATVLQHAARHTPARRFAELLSPGFLPERGIADVKEELLYWMAIDSEVPLLCFDHHLAHAASAFYPSGLSEATIVTSDC